MKRFLVLFFMILSFSFASALETRQIAVFKNGLGFFVQTGDAFLSNGKTVLKDISPAAFGSYWITIPDVSSVLEEAVASQSYNDLFSPAVSISEILQANVGKTAVLTADGKDIKGKITTVLSDTNIPIDYSAGNYRTLLVILSSAEGDIALPASSISRVIITDGMATGWKKSVPVNQITLRISSKKTTVTVQTSFLRNGIGWAPSYLLTMQDNGKVRLTMQALLINDAEDLSNADASFVVGSPNFIYSGILSPLNPQISLSQFLQMLNGNSGYYNLTPMQNVQYKTVSEMASAPVDFGYDQTTVPETQETGDLFLYKKSGITLKKGERAAYNMFSQEIEFQHVYEWKISDTSAVDIRGYQTGNRNNDADQIWHSLNLVNSTSYPWTTAPAFVLDGLQPLAQQELKYTPKGASVHLKLSIAPDIAASKRENESARERGVKKSGDFYDLVTIHGELSIRNYKKEAVNIEIEKKVTGEVKPSAGLTAEKPADNLQGINPVTLMKWKVSVAAGKSALISYDYQIYVRN